MENEENHSHRDAAVGEIEGGPTEAAEKVKIEKIDDVFQVDAVHEIARDATTKQSENELAGLDLETEVPAKKVDGKEGGYGQDGKEIVETSKKAPGCPGISQVGDVKEIRHDFDAAGRPKIPELQTRKMSDPIFRRLVESKQG